MSGRMNFRLGVDRSFSPVLKWALLLGLLLHLIGFVVFRVISNPLPEYEQRKPFVAYLPNELLEEDAVLMEQAALFDTAPLFIPSKWSGFSRERDAIRIPPAQLFSLYEPEINLVGDLGASALMRVESEVVESSTDFLALQFPEDLSSFGMGPPPESAEGMDWQPVVLVSVFGPDGSRSDVDLSVELTVEADFASASLGASRFGLRVSEVGMLLMAPILIDSSGDVGVDRALSDWLSRPVTVANLPRGYVEVEIYL